MKGKYVSLLVLVVNSRITCAGLWLVHTKRKRLQEQMCFKGPFTWWDCECDFFIATNGMFWAYCHCHNCTIWTLILKPTQPIRCDKEIAVAMASRGHAFMNPKNPMFLGNPRWSILIFTLLEMLSRTVWTNLNGSFLWSESDITSRCVQREPYLLFTLSSDKDQRKNSILLSVSVNEPLSPVHTVQHQMRLMQVMLFILLLTCSNTDNDFISEWVTWVSIFTWKTILRQSLLCE